MITSYKKVKEDVLRYYEELCNIVKQANIKGNDTSLQALKNQAKRIKENKFCLMIAGEAKSGKSTFINAYLGTSILPMDVRQCTSSVIEIKYGENFILKATRADGRTEKIIGEDKITSFLTKNAALNDEYRDIPVTTINNEIIIKYKGGKINDNIIKDLLKAVEQENIHHLSPEDYNKKIQDYIKKNANQWKDIIVKINIEYPYKDESMQGIRIIDSPGVNAAGKVGDITASYIESADAIMFLRPIAGLAIEANSFREFLESKSLDRNKNAMFLILTRSASETETGIKRAYDEFINMFGTNKNNNRRGVVKEQIIAVDSKAELFYNEFKSLSTEEIKNKIKKMTGEKSIEPFVKLAWFEADGDKNNFLTELKAVSNFNLIEQSLNEFGRKAHFIALSDFLERMLKIYNKISVDLKDKKLNYELKASDPSKLAVKIKEIESELIDIENRMNETVDKIQLKYAGKAEKGVILERANKVMEEYKNKINEINGEDDSSIEELEKLSFRQVDNFINFQKELQKKVVAECNDALRVALSGDNTVNYVSLEPDFTKELIEEIKKDSKKDAEEISTYTTGRTFKKLNTYPTFSQHKYFNIIKNSIIDRIESIKSQAIRDLRSFVSHTVTVYTKELAKNAESKRYELTKIKEDKKNAEEIREIITELDELLVIIEPNVKDVAELKGGIDNRV